MQESSVQFLVSAKVHHDPPKKNPNRQDFWHRELLISKWDDKIEQGNRVQELNAAATVTILKRPERIKELLTKFLIAETEQSDMVYNVSK